MKVKKYVVDSLPQAMGQIKTDLGNDAMILHTKKIKTGGFMGLFGKEKIEVIAAVDTNMTSTSNTRSQNMQSNNTPSFSRSSYPNQNPYNHNSNYGFNNQSISNANKNVDSQHSNAFNQAFTQDTIPKRQKELREIKEEKSISPATTMEKDETATAISSEVSEIKRMMLKMMMNQTDNSNQPGYKKELKDIYDRLINQGVLEEIASSLIEDAIKALEGDEESVHLVDEVRKQIIQIFKGNGVNRVIDDDVQIVHFVGPTGVGKTTTIAKLAAEKVLKQKKRIAFITADTYRIGAVDQLRTYADILHAPIEVVFSPQDTQRSIEKLKNYDLIFMDTAGRNYHNEMHVSELNNILAKTNSSQTYLVVSLTHKFEDMVSILEQFRKVNIDKVLFTKFDETLSYGSILNILYMFPYEASYITNGQNVPDDIQIFNEEKMARAILGV